MYIKKLLDFLPSPLPERGALSNSNKEHHRMSVFAQIEAHSCTAQTAKS